MDRIRETEEAARWLAARDSDAWSERDEEELARWLQASTGNRVAFIRLDAGWKQANRLKALGAGVAPGVVPPRGQWRFSPFFDSAPAAVAAVIKEPKEDVPESGRRRLRATVVVPWAAAASLLLAALLVIWNSDFFAGSRYSTPVGGLASVPMPDGSHVTLNTDSEIHVAVTEAERRIVLDRGEAFFDVAKDPKRPFVVIVGAQRVTAVGTKFSVRKAEDGSGKLRVVVTEGRVRVEAAGADAPVEVAAGGIARSVAGSALVQEKSVVAVEEYLSWRSGFLTFRETALVDAVAEFNRYNSRKIVIDDAVVAGIPIGGTFRSTNLDAFIRLLEDGFPIRAQQRDDNIVLQGIGADPAEMSPP